MNIVRHPPSAVPRASGLRLAHEALAEGRVTVSDLIGQALDAAEASKRELHAFAAIDRNGALSAAAESERRYAQGRQRALEGLAIGVKDLIDTRGVETSYGSAAYLGHLPTVDADVVSALIEQGAIPIGKTTTHEFAWGVTTASATFGDALNPLDRTRIPGGSSGGAAAAIACGAVAAGLGTDTGGSVRIPAALCGVVGFKPTFGAFPTRGIFPLAPTLDHPGILGKTVDDVAMLAGALRIEVPQDSALSHARLGIIREIAPVPLDAEVAVAFDVAITTLAKFFASTTLDEPELFDGVFEAFAHIVLTEGGVEHFRRNNAVRIAAYGPETIDRLERARTMTLGDYARAQQTRRDFTARLHRAMSDLDYLVLPTCPCTAPRVGQLSIDISHWSGTVREALMTYTAPFNVAGFPAISIPLAIRDDRLPTGLQIVAKPGCDGALLQVARQIERLLRDGA
ncbi:aspartyl-tRNA(Asn)/glutamyl-tRNA(Gln) amidotransferase subunit A [Variovorax beijingensis]|uniref:Aspartyl-tRNA(Asn)/glutamyl-tRNA(Gln) amidotransferase subunit A n=1 Tax=Variovorax beijingensis TaxID=2496117 RepID=A0A561B405_9BURK|nr:amidase [Variovorax beijingensis]TWD73605.1 aspartyl-tRNA(Asn)/glutamyl-tRNA(Gln) amidotransferase subunit A [Variovorax beijingensis]